MGLFYTAPEPTRGDIPMDIGFYFNVEQGGDICLVKPKQGHKFAGGGVSTSPCRGPALGKRTAPSVIPQGTGRGRLKKLNLFCFGTRVESLREGHQFRHPPEDCATNAQESSRSSGQHWDVIMSIHLGRVSTCL